MADSFNQKGAMTNPCTLRPHYQLHLKLTQELYKAANLPDVRLQRVFHLNK